jgi:hypothetical protein
MAVKIPFFISANKQGSLSAVLQKTKPEVKPESQMNCYCPRQYFNHPANRTTIPSAITLSAHLTYPLANLSYSLLTKGYKTMHYNPIAVTRTGVPTSNYVIAYSISDASIVQQCSGASTHTKFVNNSEAPTSSIFGSQNHHLLAMEGNVHRHW